MEQFKNRYLIETEVSELTGIALSTLRNHRFNETWIPYIKLGKSVRYSIDDVIEYIESRRILTHD